MRWKNFARCVAAWHTKSRLASGCLLIHCKHSRSSSGGRSLSAYPGRVASSAAISALILFFLPFGRPARGSPLTKGLPSPLPFPAFLLAFPSTPKVPRFVYLGFGEHLRQHLHIALRP